MCALSSSVPAWAAFFSADEYNAFVCAVNDYFVGQGLEYSVDDNGSIEVDESFCGTKRLGLINVAQHCKSAGIEHYPDVAPQYFDYVREAMRFDMEFQKNIDDFEKVKEYLGIRLYDDAYVAHLGKDRAIGSDIADNLFAMLIFDLPQTVSNVPKDRPEAWGKGEDELFEFAVKNIRNKYPMHIERADAGSFELLHVNNGHFFSPNIIFSMEEHPGLVGAYGSVVGLPHRHSALVYPIEDSGVADVIDGMIKITAGMCAEGPGSLNSNIYWYKDGKLVNLPYGVDADGQPDFMPPQEFVDMVNKLVEN